MPKNLDAIKKWFTDNRPDVSEYVLDRLLDQDGILLIAAGAFEAGRTFQSENPEAPMGPIAYI